MLLQNCFVYPDVEACGECVAALYQVVDDVEAVVLVVFGVDAAVSFFPHVILQRGFISKRFLAVQTLQTEARGAK